MTAVYRDQCVDGWRVRLDLSQQVLQLDVPKFDLDPNPNAEVPLPLPPDGYSDTLPASVLLLKAKQFDDGLYAAIALAAQKGAGRFPGKQALLRLLAKTLSLRLLDCSEAAAVIYAACRLGRQSMSVPPEAHERVGSLIQNFLSEERDSKPLGFYTWTAELSSIFCQDRFLNQELGEQTAFDLAHALDSTPAATAMYAVCLQLNSTLTNPAAGGGLRRRYGPFSFFPKSRSHEQVLVEQLYGNKPVPKHFSLMDELIARIRSNRIDIEPQDDSGWYDYQTWAIEPLVVPDQMQEVTHLKVGEGYGRYLEEIFRSMLALTRETHVKQLAIAMAGCSMEHSSIKIRPNPTIEPLPTLYARKAASYRFVHSALEKVFGAETLAEIHGLTHEGPRALPLADELTLMERIFEGAAATARQELGLQPNPDDTAEAQFFAAWRNGLAKDQDITRDCRMMVPVFFYRDRKLTKVWAILGWSNERVVASYLKRPSVVSIESLKPPEPEPNDRLSVLRRKFRQVVVPQNPQPPSVHFQSSGYDLAAPVFVETYVSRLLDRDEFRAHCDRYKTKNSILENLK